MPTDSPVSVSPATQIGSSAAQSDLAVLQNGTIVSVYRTTGDFHIAVQRLDGSGQPLGGAVAIPVIAGTSDNEPDVVALTDGRFLVTWSVFGGDYPDYRIHLRGQIFNADGSVALPDFALTDQSVASGTQYRHSVTALAGGGFEVSYQQGQGDMSAGGRQDGVYVQAYSAQGAPVGAASTIQTLSYPGNTLRIPDSAKLATLASGVVATAIESNYNDFSIYTQVLSPSGTSSVLQLSTTGYDESNQGARIVALDDGRYVVAWSHYFAGSDTAPADKAATIQGAIIEQDGTTIDSRFSLTTSGGTSLDLSLSALSGGKFVVSWAYSSVFAQEFNADGTARGATVTISPFAGDPDYYAASIGLGGDTFLESWTTYNTGTLSDALVTPTPATWNRFSGPSETTLLASAPNFAAAMAGATAGNELALVDPAGMTVDLGTPMIAVNNLTVKGDASLDADFVLGAKVAVFTLIGTSDASITGNALSNTITGGDGDNVLVGGAGNDRLNGGLGNDTADYSTATGALKVSLAITAGQNLGADLGVDTLTSIENLIGGSGANTLTGNALANVLRGGGAADILDGGAGVDTMTGGRGDDRYSVDNAGDAVTESAGQGSDTVYASVDWTMTAGQEIEFLRGNAGSTGLHLTGNTLVNTLVGNMGDDTLDGGGGADILQGGAGNDTYLVGNVGVGVRESANAGIDTVRASITFTLSVNVENLTLVGSDAINGTGNTGDNVIIGNGAANILSGGAGADTLVGGAGADRLTGGADADTFLFLTAADSTAATTGRDTITDFSAADQLDFRSFGAGTSVVYHANAANTGGTLTLGNGSQRAAVTLQGGFASSGFLVGSDGHGGSSIFYSAPALQSAHVAAVPA